MRIDMLFESQAALIPTITLFQSARGRPAEYSLRRPFLLSGLAFPSVVIARRPESSTP